MFFFVTGVGSWSFRVDMAFGFGRLGFLFGFLFRDLRRSVFSFWFGFFLKEVFFSKV